MKRAFIAAAAALLSNSFLTAPAFAIDPKSPTIGEPGQLPDDICLAQLTPAEASEFTTFATNFGTPSDWVTVGTELGDAVGDPYGVGTPIYSNFVFDGTYFRNGGSPNVWGGASATTTYPQTGQLFETLINQERTTTFDCHVHKDTGTHVEPPGLQSSGNTAIEEQQIAGDNQEVVTEDDFIIYGEAVNTLICISPNNTTKGKPGTWTQKHGFIGSCTEASTIAGTTFIPSNNNPIVD